jgi:methylenetetrahydrofolate reductase (NADPH)
MKAINAGRFVYTGEIEPLKTTRLDDVIKVAEAHKGYVVACNVTDNPKGCAYLSSLVASYIIQKEVGMEAVYQMTVRDRNRLALFSDLLGAAALGIKNILAISGDHTTYSDNPGAMPVYDIDTAQFVYMIRKMVDEGVDLQGNKIDGEVKLNVAIAGNPNADPLEPELLKVERKVKLGADFMQTQVVFEMEPTKRFLREMKKYSLPVTIGIFPCKSSGVAKFFDEHIPGVSVPKDFMEKLIKADKTEDKALRKERIDEVNLKYFTDFIKEIKKTTHASGIHIMAVGYERLVKPLVESVSR